MKAKIEKTVNATAVMITLTGQLDVMDSRELAKIVDTDQLERDVIVFDMSKATYISSSVLGQMVAIRSKLNAINYREPIVLGCNEQIFNLFEMTGVAHLFKFVSA